MSGAPLLQVERLSARYGRIEALKDVSFSVAAGRIVALVGANGAGKSTLLRVLSGVQPAAGGTVRFQGQDITRASARARVVAGICQSPEGRQVFAPLSVEDNLRLGGYVHGGAAHADIESAYAMFPVLRQKRLEAAGGLSGGQQQMLAIARALAGRPRLLLLDEPGLGLAPLLVAEVFRTIAALKERGITVLVIEQNAAAALAIADEAHVIESGRVVLSGSGHELLGNEAVKKAYLGI